MPSASQNVPDWLTDSVSEFGRLVRDKLAGPGEPEAAIRMPLEVMLTSVGDSLGVKVVFFDEVRDAERQVRPDYAFNVNGALTGYMEVKKPGASIDPVRLRGHDLRQWERQRDLPNLIYTNGTQWRLYRDGELVAGPVDLGADLYTAGDALAPDPGLEALLREAFTWQPAPITNVRSLVRAVAPLTRLLRGEVADQLVAERRDLAAGASPDTLPFTGLAADWRGLLFPEASETEFADGYAQTVTFALLLARTRDIDLTGQSLRDVGAELGHSHSLMGRALQLLTEPVTEEFQVSLGLLVRVIGAVRWNQIQTRRSDPYLYLYEQFLEEYDPALRQSSGSYYTPHQVVQPMVRLVQDVLVTRLGKATGFADPSVTVIDPAMGTGAYLQEVLSVIFESAEAAEGSGAAKARLTQAVERIIGFELQTGPFAVAQLRASDLLAGKGAPLPPGGMRLFVTDTLDDPSAPQQQLGSSLAAISRSRADASAIKADRAVTVVLGNPPWDENASGRGSWVENGSGAHGSNARSILEDFRIEDDGRYAQKLKNMLVYFWRWATWKVWESTPAATDGDAGVVCFITTSSYATGPAFKGMRKYLREWASEGWFIDVSPEGQQPSVATRLFPGVQQRIGIGLFVREPGTSKTDPAAVKVTSIAGRQKDKFAKLAALGLDDASWTSARTAWTARFTPEAEGDWDSWPAMDDLFPWTSPGVALNRKWPYSPSPGVLKVRWNTVVGESDLPTKRDMFKESRDAHLEKEKAPLPSPDAAPAIGAFMRESGPAPALVRVSYRAFDRQWVIPDSRLMHAPRPPLWAARVPGQVFITELHETVMKSGPSLTFSALIPDMHAFKGSEGGRVLPLLHADGTINIAAHLPDALAAGFGAPVAGRDVLAYVAAIAAHPAFRKRFADQLLDPGIRIPLTKDPALWAEGVRLGEFVLDAHTFGSDGSGTHVTFPPGDPRRVTSPTTIATMPTEITYDTATRMLHLGGGTVGPIDPRVYEYEVGGRNVLAGWLSYRSAPGTAKGSGSKNKLDQIMANAWEPDWTTELLQLTSTLTRLVELEADQVALLDGVLAGDVFTTDELIAAGVRWSTDRADRRTRGASGRLPESVEK